MSTYVPELPIDVGGTLHYLCTVVVIDPVTGELVADSDVTITDYAGDPVVVRDFNDPAQVITPRTGTGVAAGWAGYFWSPTPEVRATAGGVTLPVQTLQTGALVASTLQAAADVASTKADVSLAKDAATTAAESVLRLPNSNGRSAWFVGAGAPVFTESDLSDGDVVDVLEEPS